MSSGGNLATDFRDVDTANVAKIQRCLDAMQGMDSFKSYKQRTLELLSGNGGSAALDIGCGLGDDVIKLSDRFGRAVGVDASRALVEAAKQRHQEMSCAFIHADARKLPFDDSEFDAVRIDRSLQHIANPEHVIAEMARVTKAGGIVLCAEPDWGTFFIGAEESDLTKAMQTHWASSFQNPWIGRQLSALMMDAGVKDIHIEGHLLLTRDFADSDLVFDITATLNKVESFGESEKKQWLADFKNGQGIAGVMLLTCAGQR